MDNKKQFKVIYSSDVLRFLKSIDSKAAAKILYNINKSSIAVDKELFKKLVGTDIWEFRTLYRGISYRILAFWDSTCDALVVTTHAFVKKDQKTPLKEIRKAELIRDKYFKLKNNGNDKVL